MAVTTMNESPAIYRITTDRLFLRCWRPDDAASWREAVDESANRLRPWIPFMNEEPRSLEETVDWLRSLRALFDTSKGFRYAVLRRDGQRLIGENMLLPRVGLGGWEVGYWTRRSESGRGYAAEATQAMVRIAFEVFRARRVEIHCAPENTASAAIPPRLGFTLEATLRERARDTEGNWRDMMIWTLFSESYPASAARKLAMKAYDGSGRPVAVAAAEDGNE